MDIKSGSLTIALGATEYKRYPKDEKPTYKMSRQMHRGMHFLRR